jgi:hypothetical protein
VNTHPPTRLAARAGIRLSALATVLALCGVGQAADTTMATGLPLKFDCHESSSVRGPASSSNGALGQLPRATYIERVPMPTGRPGSLAQFVSWNFQTLVGAPTQDDEDEGDQDMAERESDDGAGGAPASVIQALYLAAAVHARDVQRAQAQEALLQQLTVLLHEAMQEGKVVVVMVDKD